MAKLIATDHDHNDVSKIVNLPNPTDAQDAATKGYVDAKFQKLAWKDDARVASTANVNIASPGSSIDSVSLSTDDRVLLKDQTDDEENGIYIWNGASTPMTRSPDADTFEALLSAVVAVTAGTTNTGTRWVQTEVSGTIDVDPITFESFDSTVPDASETVKGKIEIATQGEADTGTDDARALTPLKAKTASWILRKHSADVGDGSNTSYTVTHNFNTRDVQVSVRRNSGNYDEIDVEVRANNVNSVDVVFSSAPTSNQFRVIVEA